MKRDNIIKTIKYLNPFNNLEKLLIIAKEDREDSKRLIFYSSNLFKSKTLSKQKQSTPVRINKCILLKEAHLFTDSNKEELQKYITQSL